MISSMKLRWTRIRCAGVDPSSPAGFSVFLSDPDSSQIWETGPDPVSPSNFSRSLSGHFWSKTMVIFGCLDCSQSLNWSRILKFQKFLGPDPVSKILDWSLKKWLWPPLVWKHSTQSLAEVAGTTFSHSDSSPVPKFLNPGPVSREMSGFTPRAHAQSNILHVKYAKKTHD